MTIQELLQKINSKGLNDYALEKELDQSFKTPQSTLFRLRTGSHKRTCHERYIAIESVYKKLLEAEK
jgi:hypothetical protein